MGQLHVAAELTAAATPDAIWTLISDANRYPEWGPWSAGGYRRAGDTSPRGPGAIQWLRSSHGAYLRYVTTVEKILEAEEGRRLAYTVIGGIPVRNYQAEVTLTPTPDGTCVRWAATWDPTLQGRIVQRSLRKLYPRIVAALAAAAERQAGALDPGSAPRREANAAMGASKGAFYHYFGSKAALLDAVVGGWSTSPRSLWSRSWRTAVQKFEGLFAGLARWKAARRDLILAVLHVWFSEEKSSFSVCSPEALPRCSQR